MAPCARYRCGCRLVRLCLQTCLIRPSSSLGAWGYPLQAHGLTRASSAPSPAGLGRPLPPFTSRHMSQRCRITRRATTSFFVAETRLVCALQVYCGAVTSSSRRGRRCSCGSLLPKRRVICGGNFFFLFPGVHFICPDRPSIVAYRIARFRAAARMWCALTAQFLLHLRHVPVECSTLVRGLWC